MTTSIGNHSLHNDTHTGTGSSASNDNEQQCATPCPMPINIKVTDSIEPSKPIEAVLQVGEQVHHGKPKQITSTNDNTIDSDTHDIKNEKSNNSTNNITTKINEITTIALTAITSKIKQNVTKEDLEKFSQLIVKVILKNPFLSFFIITILSVLYSKLPSTLSIIVIISQQFYHLIMRIIGTTIGIALGLGFAIHIRELLDAGFYNHHYYLQAQQDKDVDNNNNPTTNNERHNHTITKTASSSFLSASTTSAIATELGLRSGSFQFIPNPFMNHTTSRTNSHESSSTHHINFDREISDISHTNSSNNLSSSSYQALMTNAGYAIPKNHLLRGQILRNISLNENESICKYMYCEDDIAKRSSLYHFPVPKSINNNSDNNRAANSNYDYGSDDYDSNDSKGQLTFSRMWPNLPKPIQNELGILVDYILRDYITSWYSYVDSGVQYEDAKTQKFRIDEEEKKKKKKDRKGNEKNEGSTVNDDDRRITTMVLSTSAIRTIPFLEILYTSLTAVLGNLSVFVGDNVNIFELMLLKFVHILKVNIRTYRKIRNVVLEMEGSKKQRRASNNDGTNSNDDTNSPTFETSKKIEPVSEISIIREYLVQGKLHRAITFGMDIPGLLFGDAKGEECLLPDCYTDLSSQSQTFSENGENLADEILRRRLFGRNSRLLYECELDYNRVISHRLGRILFQRADFNSPILRSATVEMLASCVITPIMGCATPDYINNLILSMLGDASTNQMHEDSLKSKVNIDLTDNLEPEESLQIFGDMDEDEEDYMEEHQDVETDNLEASDDEETVEDDNEYGEEIVVQSSHNAPDSNDISTAVRDSMSLDTHNVKMATTDSIDISMTAGPELGDIEIANSGEISYMDPSDEILALLSMALIEIGVYIDYDDARRAKEIGEEFEVDWNEKGCKEVIRNLVLVLEAVLIHGLLPKRRQAINCRMTTIGETNSIENEIKPNHNDIEQTSLINLLMVITSDLESFEHRSENNVDVTGYKTENEEFEIDIERGIHQIPKPTMAELGTLRTLIAAWLHTGLVHRILSTLVKGGNKLLKPFYHDDAFILESDNFMAFLRQLRLLHEVELIVDTAIVLPCQPLDLFQLDKISDDTTNFFPPSLIENSNEDQLVNKTISTTSNKPAMKMTRGLPTKPRMPLLGRTIKANFENNKKKISTFVRVGANIDKNAKRFISTQGLAINDSSPTNSGRSRVPAPNQHVPSHLNFHRNEVFATSLRNERMTRMQSFLQVFNGPRATVEMICRSRMKCEKHFAEHRELHNLAKCFYYNTNVLLLKGEYHKIDSDVREQNIPLEASLLLESISTRRKTSIPEDDSSFLLRAQPCPLNIVSIHRDQRNSSLSYKKYVGYYDEPILHAQTKTDRGGRLRRRCFVRYYPHDRTASMTFIQVDRRLDYRDKKTAMSCISVDNIDFDSRPKEFERLPCNKFHRKGSERSVNAISNSILASSLMDSTDFSSSPRTGRAIDFLYRASLFEEPAIEMSGKKIIVQDASAIGCHQADASSIELSDASLSTALILDSYNEDKEFYVKCNPSGIPLVFMKVMDNSSNSSQSESKVEPAYKSFRISFVRAALLVASSKEEAKLSCLQSCMRLGSAKNATKSKMDSLLQMPLFLLEYATSRKREKQSILLRDLKLGINHVDRDQLRRNGIYNPRYPTILKQLKVKVEDAVEVKGNNGTDLLGQNTVLYKIRCIAVTEYVGVNADDTIDMRQDGTPPEYGDLYHEEWVVWRPFRDFASLHKVLKTMVNPSLSSAGTGAKIVGAATGLATAATGLATAALTIGSTQSPGNPSASMTKRGILVPSLSQAAKAGALGTTRKSIEKRKQLLHGYLRHLLGPNNHLNRCPELLRFLGAFDPLPLEIKLNQGIIPDFKDALGRGEMKKSLLQSESITTKLAIISEIPSSLQEPENEVILVGGSKSLSPTARKKERPDKNHIDPARLAMLESIRKRMERVKLSQVRASMFDLMRYTFDLDNASFFRNRMVAALKTISFAFTNSHGFQKTILNFYLKYLTGKSVAYYVRYLRELIWPDGVIFTSSPPLSVREQEELKVKSAKLLHQAFPDQLSTVLGQDNTDNGIDILHEMLQNRVVLKSMSYMMLDALWLEIFPEIGDILTCSSVLDHVED